MKANRIIWFVLGSSLLTLASGCATSQLWDQAQLDCWNEPADNPHLRLFKTADEKNFLVIYDEYSERADSTHTRAYLLNENQRRIQAGNAPYFANANLIHGLAAVPVFSSATHQEAGPHSLFAVEGHQCFTLYANSKTNIYDLPVYNDGKGTLERVALTPLTLTADATVIGGVIWFQSGCPGLVK